MYEAIALLIAIYSILILFLWLSDNGDGKRKNLACWLLFGLMWPKIKQQLENDLEQREKIVFVVLAVLIIAVFVFAYLMTDGKFFFR